MDDRGAFVFAEDGVQFFSTIAEAAAYVEAVDVEDGVYEAFISLEGERLVPQALDETFIRLDPSGDIDPNRLVALLRRERALGRAFTSDPGDPVAVANELLEGKWEVRRPKWPGWLDRRLHGRGPARIDRA